jgi:hypothetical protein
MMNAIKHSVRRRKARQGGHEILEFALVAILFIPMLLGTFVTGMNTVRAIQANHIARDLADMYIHGADFSTYNMQVVADRLATGLALEIGGSFNGNQADNIGNGGRGIVWVSQVMRVGTTTEPQCQSVGAADCTNHDSFVFNQQIRFGNGALISERPSSLGTPSAARSAAGRVQDPVGDPGARLASPEQAAITALWQTYANGRTPLGDGQAMYVVEVYFQSPDLNMGGYPGRGVYARWFF